MTKPTQAQIEAAANAMIDKMFAPHELPIDGELWCKYFETAEAALTAAAEVGQETTAEHIARDIREGRFPQKSEPLEPMEWHRRKTVASTIERCAQVAESIDNFTGSEYDDGATGYGYREAQTQIAAAIRALKDKP